MNDDSTAAGRRADDLLPGLGYPGDVSAGVPIVVAPAPGGPPSGGARRWFVPIERGPDLLGYLLLTDDAVLSHSSFAPPMPARDWVDADHIRQRAERFGGGAATGPAVLTHDGPAAHLAWRVPLAGGVVMVAGSVCWWQRPRPDDVTG